MKRKAAGERTATSVISPERPAGSRFVSGTRTATGRSLLVHVRRHGVTRVDGSMKLLCSVEPTLL